MRFILLNHPGLWHWKKNSEKKLYLARQGDRWSSTINVQNKGGGLISSDASVITIIYILL